MIVKKYTLISSLLIVNVAISTLMFLFDKYSWYLVFVSLSNIYRILLIFIIFGSWIVSFFKQRKNKDIENNNDAINIGIVIPCYTEGNEELLRTLQSIKICIENTKKIFKQVNFICMMLVDGKKKGNKNDKPTYQIVEEILKCSFDKDCEYDSWKGTTIKVELSYNESLYGNYIVMCKGENVGKKDSLIITRELIGNKLNNSLQEYFNECLELNNIKKVDYLVGVDADTRLDENFIINIIRDVEPYEILGVSGYAIPDNTCCSKWNPLFFYQSFEYHLQQGLTRLGQSKFGKVTCLPGCAQIWKMDERTLKDSLDKFKVFGDKGSIIQSIRALLGEDRRYTGLVLYNNKDCKTTLCNNAYAYTSVPTQLSVFLSQRRRWFLSSQVNNMSDFLSSKLPVMIRFIAFTQLWNSAFILVNAAAWVKFALSLRNPTVLTFVAFSVYLFIFLYKIGLCLIKGQTIMEKMYLLCSAIAYSIFAPFINIVITFHGLFTMTDFNWGETQKVES